MYTTMGSLLPAMAARVGRKRRADTPGAVVDDYVSRCHAAVGCRVFRRSHERTFQQPLDTAVLVPQQERREVNLDVGADNIIYGWLLVCKHGVVLVCMHGVVR